MGVIAEALGRRTVAPQVAELRAATIAVGLEEAEHAARRAAYAVGHSLGLSADEAHRQSQDIVTRVRELLLYGYDLSVR